MCCFRKYPYPSHRRFFGLNPPLVIIWKFQLKIPYIPLKLWLLRTPAPLEFSLTFNGVGMDIFWNCTINNNISRTQVLFLKDDLINLHVITDNYQITVPVLCLRSLLFVASANQEREQILLVLVTNQTSEEQITENLPYINF